MEERIETIVILSCLYFNSTPQEFFSATKDRRHAYARAAAATLIRRFTTLTVKEIGLRMGRTHATVLTWTNSMSHMLATEIESIENKFKRVAKI